MKLLKLYTYIHIIIDNLLQIEYIPLKLYKYLTQMKCVTHAGKSIDLLIDKLKREMKNKSTS